MTIDTYPSGVFQKVEYTWTWKLELANLFYQQDIQSLRLLRISLL